MSQAGKLALQGILIVLLITFLRFFLICFGTGSDTQGLKHAELEPQLPYYLKIYSSFHPLPFPPTSQLPTLHYQPAHHKIIEKSQYYLPSWLPNLSTETVVFLSSLLMDQSLYNLIMWLKIKYKWKGVVCSGSALPQAVHNSYKQRLTMSTVQKS